MTELREWVVEVSEPWYGLLEQGVKSVEGRKASPKWRGVQAGDTLIFVAPDGSPFRRSVAAVRSYSGPRALEGFLEREMEAALPGVKTLEEAAAVYLQWWTLEEIQTWGVLALEVARS